MSAPAGTEVGEWVCDLTLWTGQVTSTRMIRHPLRPSYSANRGFEAHP